MAAVRDGTWATPDRVHVYPRLCFWLFSAGVAGWLLTAGSDLRDVTGKPLFMDFIQFHAAATLLWEGRIEAIWDFDGHDVAVASFGRAADLGYWGYPYPPTAVLLVAWLAPLPYVAAAVAWVGVTLVAAWGVARRVFPGDWVLVAGFPAVFVSATHGQNGLLSAALLGGILLSVDRRPLLAGALVGVLAYKPQLGVLLPIAFAAGGHWRAFAASGASVLALAGLSVGVLGLDSWRWFADSLVTSQAAIASGAGGFGKAVTVMTALRVLGAPAAVANAVQAVMTIAVASGVAWLWWRPVAADLKAAGLLIAIPLATPYLFDYDLTVTGMGLAFLAREIGRSGWRPYEASAIAAVWVVPLVARVAALVFGVPLGPIVLAALFCLVLTRAAATPGGA